MPENRTCHRCKQIGHVVTKCTASAEVVKQNRQYCRFCRKNGHTTADCRSKPKVAKKDNPTLHPAGKSKAGGAQGRPNNANVSGGADPKEANVPGSDVKGKKAKKREAYKRKQQKKKAAAAWTATGAKPFVRIRGQKSNEPDGLRCN